MTLTILSYKYIRIFNDLPLYYLSLWDPLNCSTLGFPVLHYLLEFAQTHVHWVSDTIQPFHPLSPPSPLALSLTQHQGLFQWLTLCIRWPKYWSFTFSISPSNKYSGLISFRIGWFDLLVVQETQESSSTPQFESISSSVLCLLCGPTLTCTHDNWKTHSFDYTDLCQQSYISVF